VRNASIFLIILGIIWFGCGEKMMLPSVESSPEAFGANDTSYIHLTPDWDASVLGYSPATAMEPTDIAIGDDGYLFVADRANDRILTVTESGDEVTQQNLNKISPVSSPLGIAIDAKLNLLIVNGSNTIYCWNQYINNIGVTSVAVDTNENGDLLFSNDPQLLDSVQSIYPFYTDPDVNSSFFGVTFGPKSENTIFVTDAGTNRILKLGLYFSAHVKLENDTIPLFSAKYIEDIATFGSGAGTVDNPRGITCDSRGNIYFTQLGGNFLVQKLIHLGNRYSSAYTLYIDPIMDLNRFVGPFDIALGQNDAIFVLDTQDNGRVSKFLNTGAHAGEEANLGNKGLSEATFDNPMGIAISESEVVYIANTNQHRIERYQYSISESDIPQEPQ
jgi:hypothetical protein